MRKAVTILTVLATFLLLRVPALATNPDKVDLEKQFMDKLALYQPQGPRQIPADLARIGKDLYVCDNGEYESESVRNVAFFLKTGQSFSPVRDTLLPVQSTTTLLSGFTEGANYTVELLQHRYNYETVEVELPLYKLISFCLSGGCIPYVGVEQDENGIIKASLFMVNEGAGYCHTFNFTIPKAIFCATEGKVKAEAYTFTPIHNLAK